MSAPSPREVVSGIETIWDLDDGRIPEKGERFCVIDCDWTYEGETPVRTIRKVEILADSAPGDAQ